MAPVRLWGDLSYDYRYEDFDKTEDTIRQLVTLNMNANSYIWQPWFIRVSGGLGLTYSQLDQENSGSYASDIITGNALMSVLPQSRFPFEMQYRKTDSRVTGEATGSVPYSNTLYGVTQRYRSLDGTASVQARYDYNTQRSLGREKDISKLITLAMSKNYKKNLFKFDGKNENSFRKSTNVNYRRNNAVARHTYRPDSELSMENTLSVVETNDETTAYSNRNRQLQLFSNTFWRPRNSPTIGSAGLRYYKALTEQASTKSEGDTLNAYGSLSYSFSKRLRGSGGITATKTRSNGGDKFSSVQNMSLTFNPEEIKLGKYQYRWNTSGGLSNRSGDGIGGQRLSAQIAHNLQRRYALSPIEDITTTYNQGLSSEYDSRQRNRHRINHSASISWRQGKGGSSNYVRFMASDSRSVASEFHELYQALNLQITSSHSINYKSGLSGNLSWNASKNINDASSYDGFTTNASASLIYRHIKAFNIRRLLFISDLKIYKELSRPSYVYRQNRDQNVWDNRFEYGIGRLRLRLSLKMSEVGTVRSNLLWFKVSRFFGN